MHPTIERIQKAGRKGGDLFVGDQSGTVFLLDSATGAEVWSNTIDPDFIFKLWVDESENIYVAGRFNLYRMDINGNVVWTKPFSTGQGSLRGVELDGNGDIIISQSGPNDQDPVDKGEGKTYKVDPADGLTIWTFSHTTANNVNGDVVNPNTNEIYTAQSTPQSGGGIFGDNVRKITPAGGNGGTFGGAGFTTVAVDEVNNEVFVGGLGAEPDLRKLNSSLSSQWTSNAIGIRPSYLTINYDDNIIYGGAQNIRAFNMSTGGVIWSNGFSTNGPLFYINGSVYAGGDGGVLNKYNATTGALIWSQTYHTGEIRYIDVDEDENIYTSDDAGEINKVDAAGNLLWSISGFSTAGGGRTFLVIGHSNRVERRNARFNGD